MDHHFGLSGRYLTQADTSALVKKTEGTLAQDRYMGRGLPYVKFGRKVLYDRADVETFLDSCKVTPGAAA